MDRASQRRLDDAVFAGSADQSSLCAGAAPLGGEVRRRLGDSEFRRRIWHMAPGLLPIASWAYPHKDPLSPTFKWIAVGIIVGLATTLLARYRTVQREDERNGIGAVAGYAFSVLLTLLLFPSHAELGMAVLVVLAFGDGSATLGGLYFAGPKLPWNGIKSWSGTACFVLVGGPLASLAYLAESQPKADWQVALSCGMAAALAAAIVESLPVKLNDNIRVGVTSAVVLVAMHAWLVGL
ncbi:MAG: hypothetical protein CMJ78_15745 [Planctomycetaceae bacterium]|nr:hypothetical protein [Planctomycetaceae bacterium]